ncbi:MAG: hypothetical protein E7030_07315 [Akkermansiaceae bacterium]|nr:hypothetical protein [Akkermansiaceae bacterium]
MKIPPHWVKEQTLIGERKLTLCGSSFESMEHARAQLEHKRALWQAYLANPAAHPSFVSQLRALDMLPHEQEYHVTVTESIAAQLNADNVITRNRYGSLVLNSESLCFVDVDSFNDSLLRRLFGLHRSPELLLLQKVRSLCAEDSTLSARVYRTAHGWRVLLQGAGISPVSPRMEQLFDALQADPLYRNLCRKQLCWRARLSPKPYHLGLPRFPFLTDSAQAPTQMAEWLALYEQKTAPFGVCRLLDSFGPSIESDILQLHDTQTRALIPDLPLR